MTEVRMNLIKTVCSKLFRQSLAHSRYHMLAILLLTAISVQFISLIMVMVVLVATIVLFPRKAQKGMRSSGPFLPHKKGKHLLSTYYVQVYVYYLIGSSNNLRC